MADSDSGEKTEEPTGKKITDASNKGQVAQSQEIQSWAILLTITIIIGSAMPTIMGYVTRVNRRFIESAHAYTLSPEDFQFIFKEVITENGIVILPLMLLFVIVGFSVQVIQVGWNISAEKFQININKFSPAKGVKKFFGVRPIVEALKGMVKLGIVGTVVLVSVAPMLKNIELLAAFEILHTLGQIQEIAIVILVVSVMIMTVIAALDYAYQKWDHKNKHPYRKIS